MGGRSSRPNLPSFNVPLHPGVPTHWKAFASGVEVKTEMLHLSESGGLCARFQRTAPQTNATRGTVVCVHGKTFPKKPHQHYVCDCIGRLVAEFGHEVLAPVMPYSDWSGNLESSLHVLEEVVASTGDYPVILVGHSLGAIVSAIACSTRFYGRSLFRKLVGICTLAPGHLLPHSRAIVEATAASVFKARSMDSNQYATFPDINCFELYESVF